MTTGDDFCRLKVMSPDLFCNKDIVKHCKSLPEKSSLTYENISEIGWLSAVLFPSNLHRMKSNVEFERTKNHAVQLGSQRRTEFSQVISFH